MKKIKWERLAERRYSILSLSLNFYLSCLKNLRKFGNFDIEDGFIMANDIGYQVEGTMSKAAQYQVNGYNKDGDVFLWKMSELCEKTGEKLIKESEKIKEIDLSKMSNKQIADLFSEKMNYFRDFSVFLLIILSMQKFLNEKLREIIGKKDKDEKEIERISNMLIQPLKMNEGQKENISILEIVSVFKKKNYISLLEKENKEVKEWLSANDGDLEKEIKEHLEKYSWLQVRWLIGELMTFEEVLDRVRVLIKTDFDSQLLEMKRKTEEVKKEFSLLDKKLKFNDEEREFINIVKEYVYLRTFRTDILNIANRSMMPLIEECARRIGISYDNCLYLVWKEIVDALISGKLDKKIDIEKRRENYAVYRHEEEIKVFQGKKEVDDLIEEQGLIKQKENEEKEVRGNTAWKGKVRGKAKILFSPEDMMKVKRGDILIAVMTFPSFIAAMEKAAAFVTDEGGILCHAAIVAREMKKPCVIGTKIATKVFRDGDEIEVDADKGEVKIIKRKDE